MSCYALSGKQDSTSLDICVRNRDVSCRGFLLTGGVGWCLRLLCACLSSVAGNQVTFLIEATRG